MKTTLELISEATQQIESLHPAQVRDEITYGEPILIDLRESHELTQHGKIPGSVHAARGMLEFYADPALPYYKPEFKPTNRLILHCASGGRSALAAITLRQMGFTNVAHLTGGFNAWKAAGLPVID